MNEYKTTALPTAPPRTIDRIIRDGIHKLENLSLLVIAIMTLIAMGQEIVGIIQSHAVALKDLLLMFIYVEVLGMVGAYYASKRIPITLPLFIAMTALARLVILQGKDLPPINLLYESGAILVLALSCAVISYPWGGQRDSSN